MSTRYTRAADKELNDKHTKILLDLLQKPENRLCADCKKKDPRWASWNLGIFICIRCSGTHRSLGTHISKVKSVDLDTWIPEQVENMVNMGNEKANTYWEAGLNGRLPTDSNIDAWIRAKYQHKKWVQDTSSPVLLESIVAAQPTQEPKTVVPLKEDNCNPPAAAVNIKRQSTLPDDEKPALTVEEKPMDFASFQQQLSGLSGYGQTTNSGLIPKAPPGSNLTWTNFLNGKSADTSNNVLSQPSKEKPLIPLDAFASLLKQ